MARQSVRVRFASYRGGIPGQERLSGGKGSLHLGPKGLYVSDPKVLGTTVLGVKCGQVDLDKISSIGIGKGTDHDSVALTVHLNEGSAGYYEIQKLPREKVFGLLQPVATQLGIRISEESMPSPEVREETES